MFAMRAAKLFELYRAYDGLDADPRRRARRRSRRTIFRAPLETIWDQTRAYFRSRDPAQVERAERDPKHKMALVFRWYLGLSSHWANAGEPTRTVDYQVWCGPAMAAFNEWVQGSFLERPENRRVVDRRAQHPLRRGRPRPRPQPGRPGGRDPARRRRGWPRWNCAEIEDRDLSP